MSEGFSNPRVKEKELALEMMMFVASMTFGEAGEELEGTPEEKQQRLFALYNECTGVIGVGAQGSGERSDRSDRGSRGGFGARGGRSDDREDRGERRPRYSVDSPEPSFKRKSSSRDAKPAGRGGFVRKNKA